MSVKRNPNPLILLVDDNPSNLHMLAAVLRSEYRIKTATRGKAALALAANLEDLPDLVLLDVMMPEMTGIQVLEALRSNSATTGIPVIVISADASEQTQLEGLDQGADDYLMKPFIASVLKAKVRNLLRRKQQEAELRLAAHVFEYSGEAMLVADREHRIVDVNPAFTRLTGYEQHAVRGLAQSTLVSDLHGQQSYDAIVHHLQEADAWQGELWIRCQDGVIRPELVTLSVVRDGQGQTDFIIANYADISAQKAVEEAIRKTAHHDPLTGLSNRLFLLSNLQQAILLARRQNSSLVVMFLDLDGFKQINDTLGHDVGDALLISIAERLKKCVRESDLVARLGGDEFVLVLVDAHAPVEVAASRAASKILEELARPHLIGAHTLIAPPSIGISLFPQDGDEFGVLMKSADTAMYRAKSSGGACFKFYQLPPASLNPEQE